jgi:hypothetical protein
MKKVLPLTAYVIIAASTALGQCPSSFSFATNSETVSFTNQSTVSNAHYFWNFGDGTGSNSTNPIYAFPETGKYLVTLFAKDAVSNCSSYYEQWISVTKSSTNACQPGFKDSVLFTNMYSYVYLQLTDTSVNCNNYSKFIDGGSMQNSPAVMWLLLDTRPARYVGRMRYYTNNNNVSTFQRAVYKTVPFRYTSAKNYNPCSANFEFKIVSQNTSGQRILYTAMNKTAATYQWYIDGTSTVIPTTDTVSVYYPFSTYSNSMFLAVLMTKGSSGCTDTLIQNIRIPDMGPTSVGVKEYNSDKFSLNIYPNPAHDKIVVSSAIEVEKMILVNALGQTVLIINTPQLKQEIDVSPLPTGIYFMKTENKQGRAVFKVVKE